MTPTPFPRHEPRPARRPLSGATSAFHACARAFGFILLQSRDGIRSRRSLAIGLWGNLLALIPFIGSALALTLGTVGGGLALHAWEGRANRRHEFLPGAAPQ